MKRMLSLILITAVLGYTAVCVLLFLMQRQMLYYPSSTALEEQLAYAAERDGVVPAKFAQRLHDGHPGRKWLHVVTGADHNFCVFDLPWFREVVVFAATE